MPLARLRIKMSQDPCRIRLFDQSRRMLLATIVVRERWGGRAGPAYAIDESEVIWRAKKMLLIGSPSGLIEF